MGGRRSGSDSFSLANRFLHWPHGGLVGGGFEMSIVSYLRALTQLGPKYVAVTDGARGAFVGSHNEIIFSLALKSKIVGTAGAGDAFGATLTAYLALGYRLEEAV